MIVTRPLGFLLAALVTLTFPVLLQANAGGSSPSTAPQLNVGDIVTSTMDQADYDLYRLGDLVSGDRVTINLQRLKGNIDTPCLYPPGADDFNWQSLGCIYPIVLEDGSEGRSRYTFVIGSTPGPYLLSIAKCCAYFSYAYALELSSIQHLTVTRVFASPQAGRLSTFFRVRAQVTSRSGSPTGICVVERRLRSGWRAAATVPVRTNECRARVRPARTGQVRFRVHYRPADGQFQPSSGVSGAVFVRR